jgi:predicted PurR-regulated permease PerM
MAVPVVCLFAIVLSQGRLNLTEDNTSGRVPLHGLAFFSICALVLSAVATARSLIDWIIPAAVAIAAAFALTGLIAVAERRLNWSIVWATLLMCGLYAWGTVIVLNNILDDAKPRVERVQVLGKDTTGSDPDYELRLAAWGTFGEKSYQVSRKLYDKVQVGQEVCVRIYPGWLGWENYYVRSCDSGKPA